MRAKGFASCMFWPQIDMCFAAVQKAKETIYKLDANTLKVRDRIKIPSDGAEMSLYRDKLYIALTPDEPKNGEKVKAVGEYDLDTGKIRFIRLKINGKIGKVLKYKNRLIVYDENMDEKEGNYINIYDLNSEETNV